ncbi:molybdopterin-containing oxidoreductase family protein [Nocardia iowensis]|uniref:Molybdopterin-dependent oxidoreductase n=1 Tax=Nocardia iowensis TaxID=204891 RepID=A0ABX8RUE3_NOCIO|nr:molybdopterin-dependent oxidoreductase [Nocardia iowensis]QXN93163.1 molybdopterin-dependent oxidoreductase [Nocardia iowensis]
MQSEPGPADDGDTALSAVRLVNGACPLDCPDACSWTVTVDGDEPVKLAGRKDHPFTAGSLCVKVGQYLEQTRSPARLLNPKRRAGPKGSGKFEDVDWATAIDMITDRLENAINRWGGESIWPYQGTGNLGYIQGLQGKSGQRLWNAIGASRHDMTICSIAGHAGLARSTGISLGIDTESLAASRLVLMWGVNTLSSGHHLWKFVQRARTHGAWIVAIDPIRTRTARLADEHIAPRPGTDALLILALIHELLTRQAIDVDYIETMTNGWPEFRDRLPEFAPAAVEKTTGVPASVIARLAARIASSPPVGIRAGMGLQRHAGGGNVLRLLACLSAVTGDWGRYGGGVSYSTDGYFGLNREALERNDLRAKPARSLSMTRLGDTLNDPDLSPPVKVLFVYGANPVASSPGQANIIRGLSREDLFTVVVDHFQTDTCDYADLILPATMQTEHLDIHDGNGHMYIAWNEPAVAPAGQALSTTEIFRRIAAGLRLSEPCLYDSDLEIARQLMNSTHPSLHGITLESLRSHGWQRLNYPDKFIPFGDGFYTASGKFEFPTNTDFSAETAAEPGKDERYPLTLLATAAHYTLNSTFLNNELLSRKSSGTAVTLNPTDADARGIGTGCRVRVFNGRGEFSTHAEISDTVPPGVVAMTKGSWIKIVGGPTVNATVEERDADLGGGAVFHDNNVDVQPLDRQDTDD